MAIAEQQPILTLDQAGARRLLLVRAIEEMDTDGKLLSAVERDQLERAALDGTRSRTGEPDAAQYLRVRAGKVLAAVENRNPRIAALQEPEPWRRRMLWLLPLAACILGAALDRIDHPQQVNMLSPPLLGVLFWNLAAYVLLLAAALASGRWTGQGAAAGLQRWLAGVTGSGRRTGRLRADVLARFHRQWLQATGAQQAWWVKRLLHLTAAGWALGMALSIVMGGLVRQYRVGWESTLLDVGQVHAFLRFLFAPVVALLPFEGFTVADLQRMAFSSGAAIGVDEARRWVWMYLALLFIVVVVPRALLALWAAWRERRLGRVVHLDLRDPYFVEVLARVSPARVTLGVLATDAAARAVLQQVLAQAADQPPLTGVWTVLVTDKGDALRIVDLPADMQSPPPPVLEGEATVAAARPGWLPGVLARLKAQPAAPRPDAAQSALAEADLLLVLPAQPADLERAGQLARQAGVPALALVDAAGEALAPWQQAVDGVDARVLGLAAATAHWQRDATLLYAVNGKLAERQRAGFGRLIAAWKGRNEQRFGEAMRLLALLLARAARETEDLGSAPVGLRQLVKSGERESAQRAREGAAAAILERLRAQETTLLAELVRLHRIALPPTPLAAVRLSDAFQLQQQLDARQAGVAGAGTGAAMGAGIDVLVGGLTLGAAAALGAVIGGSAAYVAAAWRNRATASGRTQLQLSDEMLQSLTESMLLAYLAVAHRSADAGTELPPAWRSEVVAAVAARREALSALWVQARHALAEEDMADLLAQELSAIARGLLARL